MGINSLALGKNKVCQWNPFELIRVQFNDGVKWIKIKVNLLSFSSIWNQSYASKLILLAFFVKLSLE